MPQTGEVGRGFHPAPNARVLVSNLGDNTLQLVEVSPTGQLRALRKAAVGKAPKRVAFLTLP